MKTAPVLIYGAGGMGKQVLSQLLKNSLQPLGFIDRNAGIVGSIDGIAVSTLMQAVERYRHLQPEIIVAVHNYSTSVGDILRDLEEAGFANNLSLWQFCQQQKWLPVEPYWLQPLFDWRANQDKINTAYQLLEDPTSKKIFAEQLALRNQGNYFDLSVVDFSGQYTPEGVPPLTQPVYMIDCGAYDGDTIKSLVNRGNQIAKVFAFEPDPVSFEKLDAYLTENALGQAVNAGTHDHSGQIRFSNLGTGASHIDKGGSSVINIESIDKICHEFPVTFIKMDVEGAEAASIKGAVNTIRKYRPALALSIYHKPADLWTILLKIHELDLGYRFQIRTHGSNGFDTVLYATAI